MPEDVVKFVDQLIALHFEGGCIASAIDEAIDKPHDESTFDLICHLLSYTDEKLSKNNIQTVYDLLDYETNEWVVSCVDALANIKPQRFIFAFTDKSPIYNPEDNKYLQLKERHLHQ